ncbi:cobalamin B12-binding domain-containing protein [Alicyclobacillus tolerans]|uniref:Methanogenic corrinoid protein MtbC1 n=2 Tax=Alicyclobacillus tolerans TaxID=90970 RepID=A0ABT9LTZ8_9BACL|nr:MULTISPECIES: cobalamin-dependent protein [Alicyclobacillus]MDP9727739.1 methanogenic corrinoid protein MtbC1 [Alicyclobacillus tengchongensis]QRF24423.1 cobalamin B12-binding domain-containing protein [Alicyclobacillus sp. TC]SHK55041.1 Methanogenic corrinoid protein MtbC1 [Alicyclobacillus montanus]
MNATHNNRFFQASLDLTDSIRMKIIQFAHILLSGDERKSWEFIEQQLVNGIHSTEIFCTYIPLAMTYIGELWIENAISVVDEHIASCVCDYLIMRYQAQYITPPDQQNCQAVVACVDGDPHELGAKLAVLLLNRHGLQTHYLGVHCPLHHFLAFISKWRPSIVALSVTQSHHLKKVQDYLEALQGLPYQPEIIVGGRLIHHLSYTSSKGAPNKQRLFFMQNLHELAGWLEQDYLPIKPE